MEHSNRDFVDRGLLALRRGLSPYLEQTLKQQFQTDWWQHGVAKHLDSAVVDDAKKSGNNEDEWFKSLDVAALLKLIYIQWNAIFKAKLGEKGHIYEKVLHAVRTDWAHQKSISNEETRYALYTALLLLQKTGNDNEARYVNDLIKEFNAKFSRWAIFKKCARRFAIIALPILTIGLGAYFVIPDFLNIDSTNKNSENGGPTKSNSGDTSTPVNTSDTQSSNENSTTEVIAGNATLPLIPHFEEGNYSLDSAAKAKLINVLLEHDIEVITSIPIQMQQEELESAVKFASSRTGANSEIKGLVNQIDRALIDRKEIQVGILIVGKSSSTYLGQEANLHSSRAKIDLRAVETESWKVVASDVFQTTEADISQEAAREKALKALGEDAGSYLAEQIAAYKAEQKEDSDE